MLCKSEFAFRYYTILPCKFQGNLNTLIDAIAWETICFESKPCVIKRNLNHISHLPVKKIQLHDLQLKLA